MRRTLINILSLMATWIALAANAQEAVYLTCAGRETFWIYDPPGQQSGEGAVSLSLMTVGDCCVAQCVPESAGRVADQVDQISEKLQEVTDRETGNLAAQLAYLGNGLSR